MPGQTMPVIDLLDAQPLPVSVKKAPRGAFATSRGHCRPFGATQWPGGVNFAVFSRHAEGVDLVLFKDGQEAPLAEI